MAYVNRVFLLGNVGADPDVRVPTANGTAVANFRLATTMRWTDTSGKKQETTDWHRVVAWGRLAEFVREYVTKGRLVHIEGKLTVRPWTDKTGQKRYTTEIVAQNVQLLPSGDRKSAEAVDQTPEVGAPPTDEDVPPPSQTLAPEEVLERF